MEDERRIEQSKVTVRWIVTAVLLVHPVGGDLTMEGVKILAFWGVALYAGYLAARFQRQARILQAYEETIASLRACVDGMEAAGRAQRQP